MPQEVKTPKETIAKLEELRAILCCVNKRNFVDQLLEFSRKIWKERLFGIGACCGDTQLLLLEGLDIKWHPEEGSQEIQPHNIGLLVECDKSGYKVQIPYFATFCREYEIPTDREKDEKYYTYVPLSLITFYHYCDRKAVYEVVNSLISQLSDMINQKVPCVYTFHQ